MSIRSLTEELKALHEHQMTPEEIAQRAFADMKRERKTRIAMLWLEPDNQISVTDANGMPYIDVKGNYGIADMHKIRDELLKLGVAKVGGKVRKT